MQQNGQKSTKLRDFLKRNAYTATYCIKFGSSLFKQCWSADFHSRITHIWKKENIVHIIKWSGKLSSLPPPMDRMPSAEEDKDWSMKEKKKKIRAGGGELLENT